MKIRINNIEQQLYNFGVESLHQFLLRTNSHGHSILFLISRQGKTRLSKWYQTILQKEKSKIIRELSTIIIIKTSQMCNVLEYKDLKIIYRRYASLFFVIGVNSDDNELIGLEIIHRFVEQMDKIYGNVCELDIILDLIRHIIYWMNC